MPEQEFYCWAVVSYLRDMLNLPIKQILQTESLSTVIYVAVIDLCSSELWACFTAHEMFCFRKINKI